MSIDQTSLLDKHKQLVKSWVPKARQVLEDDLKAQLERLGIKRSGKTVPIDQMHLLDDVKTTRARVEALLNRETLSEGEPKRGFTAVLRETSYTFLNRLLGLKCMEMRRLLYLPPPNDPKGLPEETEVITPIPGQARSRYLRDLRAAVGSPYKYEADSEQALLRDGLTAAFSHITEEIRILFDPEHEYVCLWPTHACLVKVIDMINQDLPGDAYRAKDFLGWVYQFFNREEKKKVRNENKGTPRSSYELAVINQFYTPPWIVKVLVDNTLARLWLQMHPDSTLKSNEPPPLPGERISEKPDADYLVPGTGEKLRYKRLTESGEVLDFKVAKDIALLDPACGTMHFGQYAFGLFYRMYEEEIENAGNPGWPEVPSVSNVKDIPKAIIENNVFGIDIDPRAVQIASLGLLLTAKEAAIQHGHDPNEIKISHTNLVVANTVNLGEDRLRALVERVNGRFGSPEIQERLFKTLWDNLQYVGELGSLIQVREGVTRVVGDWIHQQARKRGLLQLTREEPKQLDMLTDQRKEQLRLERQLLEEEAQKLRDELLGALQKAAAEVGGDPAERLFAEDTARGLKLLQMLSRTYDVVVMNPPYGAFVPKVKDFIRSAYPLTHNDIYATFIDRATQLVEEEGYVGAIVSSTFVTLKTFEKLRKEIMLERNPLIVMLDLGFGILDDATVETAAIVLRGGAL
jgi:hypothetical protein